MDYKEKYDEALERARNLHKDAIDMEESLLAKQCEIIFPELKESEDERIKNEIINSIKELRIIGSSRDREKAIAWLEKQGEKPQGKSALEAWKDMRLEVYQQASGNRHEPNYSDDTTKIFSLNDIDEIFEKIAENYAENHTDKVESKFKVSDWITIK